LWLLLTSAFVTVVSSRATPASGFQTAGQFASTVIGEANYTSASEGIAQESLNHPFRTAFDSSGDLWVADENNHRVDEFKPPFTDGEAASLEIGQPNFAASTTNTTQSSLSGPISVAFDKSGDLWVSDFVDNRVTEYKPPFANGMNASLELGQPAGDVQFVTRVAGASRGGLAAPVDLAFDSAGDLWVDDRSNNRVVEYTPPFVDGESLTNVVGQQSTSANAASTTRNGLNGPESIAFDASGNLWVVDQLNNRVLEFMASSLETNGSQASIEIGQPAGQSQFVTSEAGMSQGGLNAPVGIAFDPEGDLLISDRANNRILGFEAPFVDGMNASFEIGHPSGPDQFTAALASVSQSSLHNPLGLTFDAMGNLWVADQLNARVLEFAATATATAGEAAVASNGDAAVNETSTGIAVTIRGLASGSLVNIYSADLDAQPLNTGSLGLTSKTAFYEVKVSGTDGGNATVCVSNPDVSDSTDMMVFGGSEWNETNGVDRTTGASICGSLPPSEMGDLVLLAIGSPRPTSGALPTLELEVLVAIAAVVFTTAIYVAMKRRPSRR